MLIVRPKVVGIQNVWTANKMKALMETGKNIDLTGSPLVHVALDMHSLTNLYVDRLAGDGCKKAKLLPSEPSGGVRSS